jgi:hypothetical protein
MIVSCSSNVLLTPIVLKHRQELFWLQNPFSMSKWPFHSLGSLRLSLGSVVGCLSLSRGPAVAVVAEVAVSADSDAADVTVAECADMVRCRLDADSMTARVD